MSDSHFGSMLSFIRLKFQGEIFFFNIFDSIIKLAIQFI
jgi:hypothetical protein